MKETGGLEEFLDDTLQLSTTVLVEADTKFE